MNCRKGDVNVSLMIAVFLLASGGVSLSAQVEAQASPIPSGSMVTTAAEGGEGDGRLEVDGVVIYEREAFQYSTGGRSDPFRSLLLEGELGVRPEDLTLRGVLIDPVAARSVAVLSQAGSERRIQLRVGERVGAIRLLSIQPDRVEIVVEELGV